MFKIIENPHGSLDKTQIPCLAYISLAHPSRLMSCPFPACPVLPPHARNHTSLRALSYVWVFAQTMPLARSPLLSHPCVWSSPYFSDLGKTSCTFPVCSGVALSGSLLIPLTCGVSMSRDNTLSAHHKSTRHELSMA